MEGSSPCNSNFVDGFENAAVEPTAKSRAIASAAANTATATVIAAAAKACLANIDSAAPALRFSAGRGNRSPSSRIDGGLSLGSSRTAAGLAFGPR